CKPRSLCQLRSNLAVCFPWRDRRNQPPTCPLALCLSIIREGPAWFRELCLRSGNKFPICKFPLQFLVPAALELGNGSSWSFLCRGRRTGGGTRHVWKPLRHRTP